MYSVYMTNRNRNASSNGIMIEEIEWSGVHFGSLLSSFFLRYSSASSRLLPASCRCTHPLRPFQVLKSAKVVRQRNETWLDISDHLSDGGSFWKEDAELLNPLNAGGETV
jgi:hypothetical protein